MISNFRGGMFAIADLNRAIDLVEMFPLESTDLGNSHSAREAEPDDVSERHRGHLALEVLDNARDLGSSTRRFRVFDFASTPSFLSEPRTSFAT